MRANSANLALLIGPNSRAVQDLPVMPTSSMGAGRRSDSLASSLDQNIPGWESFPAFPLDHRVQRIFRFI